MKKLVIILLLCSVLIFSTFVKLLPYNKPPLADIVTAPPQESDEPVFTEDTPPADEPVAPQPKYHMEVELTPLIQGQKIKYVFINNSNKALNILAIPHLEIKTPDGWQTVEFSEKIGFCGTPDCLAANSRSIEWALDVELLYGGPLEQGHYQLSFEMVDDDYNTIGVISADFGFSSLQC